MKKIFLFVICAGLFTNISGFAQGFQGLWNGTLNVGGTKLRLVIHIEEKDGTYTATMDSPDQGVKGIPVTSVSFENSVLKFAVVNAGIEYEGELGTDSLISGTLKQMGLSLPLNLSKKEMEEVKLVRPQEPTKPYPYYEEEVSFESMEAGIRLAGTLTLPQKEGNFPAVVLISGSGAQNRDEELMEHKPFLVIADYLTRNGIAVLRFDDRGTASSSGDFRTATTHDFSNDVEGGVKYLLQRNEINRQQIGLIGHSEGGIIAPMVAARSKDVAFIVLLAGMGIPSDQLLWMQQDLIAEASNISEADRKQAKSINKGMYDILKEIADTAQLKAAFTDYLNKLLQDIPDTEKSKGIYTNDQFIQASVNRMTSPWMLYFIRYNPAPVLEKVTCPVLAINGEKDLQVPAKPNLEAIETALLKGGNKQVTTKEIPGLNHLFQECKTGLPAEYAAIEQTFSPVVLDEILRWIKKQLK
ncbi:MAG: alpha/beta fold hydrolase [Dysgonamonadaceae bacterium]|jgi:fermentation-respiration switch protein FrsA (DUF1100 family)|nr:alpha/beta fold hydrolase [Dysgonamonadaceae bacterium]